MRSPQYDPKASGTTVSQIICGATEKVKGVVMASSDDHGDEVEADLGHSMKLPEIQRGHD